MRGLPTVKTTSFLLCGVGLLFEQREGLHCVGVDVEILMVAFAVQEVQCEIWFADFDVFAT